jgi:predicted RNA-binding protein with RPS1 domain
LVAQIGATNAKHYSYELAHLGEDPRGSFAIFEYQAELKSLSDLKKDTAYPGVVTNVTSFGAFVDIGIEQDGLVHISELTDALAKNPFDALFPGDPVTVFVSAVNEEKKQISLTMRQGGGAAARGGRGGERRPRGGAGRPPRGERRPPRGPRPEGEAPVAAGAEGAPVEGGEQRPRRPRREPRRREAPVDTRPDPGTRPVLKGDLPPPGSRPEGREARGGGEGRGRPREGGGGREDRKPKKPQRDTKTGAIVKMDDNDKAARGGPKLPSKAQPMAFNPFASLGSLLKNKEEK